MLLVFKKRRKEDDDAVDVDHDDYDDDERSELQMTEKNFFYEMDSLIDFMRASESDNMSFGC